MGVDRARRIIFNMRRILLCLFIFALAATSVMAVPTTYYVRNTPPGDNANNGTSTDTPWKTITYAAAQAVAGDTIYVYPGHYGTVEGEVFPIVCTGESWQKSPVAGPVTIEANPTKDALMLYNGTVLNNFHVIAKGAFAAVRMAGPNVTISSCTLWEDDGDGNPEGYGVYAYGYSGSNGSGTITGCTIHDCDYGVYLKTTTYSGIVTIESNTIKNNDLNHVYINNWNAAVNITGNTFSGCSAVVPSGAISITAMSAAAEVVAISQNTFVDNKICLYTTSSITANISAKNNIFCGDDDLNKTAVSTSRIMYAATTADAPTNSNNLYWNYGQCLYNATDGGSSVYAFPVFVDATTQDYQLHTSSPALDAGVGGINIGAYTGAGEASTVYLETSYVDGSTGVDDPSHGASRSPYATVTYANKYTYGTMNISAGNYATTESITLGQGKTFTGAGMGSTTLECTTNNGTVVYLPQSGTLNNLDLLFLGAPGDGGLNISFPNAAVNSCGIYSSAGNTGVAIYVDSNGGYLTGGKILSCEVFNCDTAWRSPATGGSNADIMTIEACTIYSCKTYGIYDYLYASTLDINRNVIRNITSVNGAINLNTINTGSRMAIIRNNTLVKNTYGIKSVTGNSSYITSYNNIISSSPEGTGSMASSFGYWITASTTINNNYDDVYGNATDYSTAVAGANSITATAEFVSVAGNDYHLTASSPCIGTGQSSLDMGAYVYVASSSYNCPVGTADLWRWLTPSGGSTVMSGTPNSWTWRTWQAGSGRQVPQGSAEAWTWGNE